jgi:uncharacterized membrane protein
MFKTLFNIDESQSVTGFDMYFRHGWIVALVAIAAAVAFAVYLYRRESGLPRKRRITLGVFQFLALLVLILLLLQPIADIELEQPYRRTILVLIDTSRSMNIEERRTSKADLTDAARILQKISFDQELDTTGIQKAMKEIGSVSRFALAKAALQHPAIDIAGRLSDKFEVRFFSFDAELRPEGGTEQQPLSWLTDLKADGETSQVGSAIEEAVARYAGQPIAGVVVLSDFAWVKGEDPIQVARYLKDRDIRIFPVGIGMPDPPDIYLRRIIAPEVVFTGDRVPLRIQIDSHGYEGRKVDLALSVNGDPVYSIPVELQGGVQFEEMLYDPKKEVGSAELELSINPLADETTDKNNAARHRVRIIDEKIKVLYVEGMPRWEYRYLRWVLLRDPRLEVKFLMTQGDPQLAAMSEMHIDRFPEEIGDALKYDLVILGDVPSTYFNATQMKRMEELVRKGGGSLLMIAGPMAAPTSYINTPIAKVLPVKLRGGQWQPLASDVHPVVTKEGHERAPTMIGDTEQINDRIWARVHPLHAVPDLESAKDGATVLLSLPKAAEQLRDYPLVAWHRYGNGKSLFVGTEELWRLRLEVGDRFHARFWGQTIQFLTLSRLLGQNKRISLETNRRTYSSSEQVRVFANVLTESFEPVVQPSYTVLLERKDAVDSEVELELTPVLKSPGLFSGVHIAAEDGTYVLKTRPADAEISNTIEFEVLSVPLEDRETAMQEEIVRQIAEQSGRERMSLCDLADLPGALGDGGEQTTVIRMEKDLWDIPMLFIMLVVFAGIEWYMRRKENLV